MSESKGPQSIMTAKATDGIGTVINCEGFQDFIIEVSTAASSDGTLKFQQSFNSDVAFGSAASVSNPWDYVAFKNMEVGTLVAGNTGITIGASTVDYYKVEASTMRYFTAILSGRSAGAVTVRLLAVDNS